MTDPKSPQHESVMAVLGNASAAKRRRWMIPLAAALVLGGAWTWLHGHAPVAQINYQTVAVARGHLLVQVTATGNLAPTNQVTVGSEQSGTIAVVLVDVNDRVRKGQVLARIDPTKLQAQLDSSRAALQQTEAQLQQAQVAVTDARNNQRRLQEVARLSGGKTPAQSDLDTATTTVEKALAAEAAAKAAVAQARAAVNTDSTNLAKATIFSPIDGVVLTRNIEPGQTVAASLQAPTLFTLAENLAQLQLQVSVDEADVGQVREGQSATFNVDAYPDRHYPAHIQRVSYGSITTNNVVSYQTLLDVDNTDLSLRPGMTATASIVTVDRDQVLQVPNAALRWSPSTDNGPSASTSVVGKLLPHPPAEARKKSSRSVQLARGSQQPIWVFGEDRQPHSVTVTVGVSDGQMTEVVAGGLKPGQAVITDSTEATP